ncbi:MAG: hypothetical protein J7M30_17100, partial [Deltaproteobacteria bacterium]|nr:hypothetical protein [Deltaproteobacteria bacterium]
ITDFQVLEKELEAVRKNGYALDEQEMRLGVIRLSAPVYDKEGKVVACLGLAAPSFRFDSQNPEDVGTWTKKLARELSTELREQTGAEWLVRTKIFGTSPD